MAEPRCPKCEIEGIQHIVTIDSDAKSRDGKPWFDVVHCDNCGHVYGVLAKHVFGKGSGPQFVVQERS